VFSLQVLKEVHKNSFQFQLTCFGVNKYVLYSTIEFGKYLQHFPVNSDVKIIE